MQMYPLNDKNLGIINIFSIIRKICIQSQNQTEPL
jgi:hypothetical protein